MSYCFLKKNFKKTEQGINRQKYFSKQNSLNIIWILFKHTLDINILNYIHINSKKRYSRIFLETPSGTFSIVVPIGRLFSIVGGSVGLSKTSVFGGEFSLSFSSSRRMGFSADPPISKSSSTVGEKEYQLLV